MFVYARPMETNAVHPATGWEQDARRPHQTRQNSLRLATIAGHMRVDKIAARRAALIDLLADGRPHPREEIWEAIAARMGEECWGKVRQEGWPATCPRYAKAALESPFRVGLGYKVIFSSIPP